MSISTQRGARHLAFSSISAHKCSPHRSLITQNFRRPNDLVCSSTLRAIKRFSSSAQSDVNQDDDATQSRDPLVDEFLRVDHAGEYGAQLIYRGQIDALELRQRLFGSSEQGFASVPQESLRLISEMKQQEEAHLHAIEQMIPSRRARPTIMLPVWHVAGYALGYLSAICGTRAAMACTVAVEEVITQHYNDQLRDLAASSSAKHRNDIELRAMLRRHRDDEASHRQIGLDNEAEQAALYKPLTQLVKAGCQVAITVAKRI